MQYAKVIEEDGDIIVIEYINGIASYDKETGMLISWEGEQCK